GARRRQALLRRPGADPRRAGRERDGRRQGLAARLRAVPAPGAAALAPGPWLPRGDDAPRAPRERAASLRAPDGGRSDRGRRPRALQLERAADRPDEPLASAP